MMKVFFANLLIYVLAIMPLAVCHAGEGGGVVMSLGLSSNGRYAVSVHEDRKVVLWDIQAKTRKVVSRHGNPHSAYFIRGRDLFLWQDLGNIVHLADVSGQDRALWHNFPTYGHVLTQDLKTYLSADEDWRIYSGYGAHVEPLGKDEDGPGFRGSGKVVNMDLSQTGNRLLVSGAECDGNDPVPSPRNSSCAGAVLWDLSDLKPAMVLYGHKARTIATLSPDGRYVVSGDDNGHAFLWDTGKKEKKFRLAELATGIPADASGGAEKFVRDDSGPMEMPEDHQGHAIMALKFIDQNHYLRFTAWQHYAILYELGNPLPLKYLDLGTHPFPATTDYSRVLAIDTAPEAGILVMGEANGPGILVYRYDPERQSLERIWTSNPPE